MGVEFRSQQKPRVVVDVPPVAIRFPNTIVDPPAIPVVDTVRSTGTDCSVEKVNSFP